MNEPNLQWTQCSPPAAAAATASGAPAAADLRIRAPQPEESKRMDAWLEQFARTAFSRSGDIAHDLKTPLNVAVLNLELLRMRIRKLNAGEDDEKILAYAHSIEVELRRLAKIFDAFFVFSTPPRSDEKTVRVELFPLCADAASASGFELAAAQSGSVDAHESRIRHAIRLFFTGAEKVLAPEGRSARVDTTDGFALEICGTAEPVDLEISKIFKFYFSDPSGDPELSLAASRLIAETYGGEMTATREGSLVRIQLRFPRVNE